MPVAGQPQGSAPSTGANPGRGSGARPPGTPQDTTFQRDAIPPIGLDPRGQAVGSFLTEGPAAAGDVTIKKGGALEKAVRELSQEVEREPLPVDKREEVQRFYERLLGGKPSTEEK